MSDRQYAAHRWLSPPQGVPQWSSFHAVRFGLLAGLPTLGPLRAAAAQAGDSTAFPLAEIVVSADRPVSEAAATVRTIGPDEITSLGARTLDEALALVPGLNVRTGGDGVPRVDLRGLRTRQVTLLLNGIPLNATDDGQFDPGLISVEEIAEIKITGGTGSVLYGQGGLSGIINVLTRDGRGAPPAPPEGRHARLEAGWDASPPQEGMAR